MFHKSPQGQVHLATWPSEAQTENTMCQYDTQLSLFENEKGYISWCKNCELYSVLYETCCIAFTRSEFKGFRKVLSSLDEDHFIPTHDGKETVFLRSTKGCMGICLTVTQVDELKEMFDEAAHMHEVYTMIHQ